MNPPPWRHLQPALLDFERAPGRYPVALREPRPLFEHIDSVILLASARPVAGLQVTPAAEQALRRAARYFVRTVMLRPGADPFTLLGLSPGFEPTQLREHYRLMIRLTHPDFSAEGERWPADAATRVNLAKDQLSSPQAPPHRAAPPRVPMRPRPMLPRPSLPRGQAPARGWPTRSRLAWAGTGAVLVAGAFLLIGPRGDEASLPAQASALPGDEAPATSRVPGAPLRDAARP
ncbi:MAG: hypothetical protein IBJ14_09260 [Hydrogenophaga sp.]|nr:hypothetical protein [Hydrogenophaga sp.]